MQREQQQQQVETLNRKIVELTSTNNQIGRDLNNLQNKCSNDKSLLQGELER